MEPDVGRSMPATRCRSVDLPPPDGPTIPRNSPGETLSATPSSATTGCAPAYTFATRSQTTAGGDEGASRVSGDDTRGRISDTCDACCPHFGAPGDSGRSSLLSRGASL